MSAETITQLNQEIENYRKKIELMQKIYKASGFFDEYFTRLKTAATAADAFNEVNDLYFDFFGEYRFTDYHSFRQTRYYYYKNHKK